ncbi:ThiJ domain protein [Schizosaccharomyces osmophilus]|uniref:ThiJ domain protein n=1 Tax=Schizosaccharomyces osmophilus TaxID=2545709 RepID=A0AAE9WC65_9SCHI|nr:ThiJ domain protein [Schizosaccharomyces osmophilus]WBW73672.1 ThiJ domain protein [Schizosaccharomyces osmophilus]
MSMQIVRENSSNSTILQPFANPLWAPTPVHSSKNSKRRTLKMCIALPDNGYDVTQVCDSWQYFLKQGFMVHFATLTGYVAQADQTQLGGLKSWFVGATAETCTLYGRMSTTSEYLKPLSLSSDSFTFNAYDLVLIPGGQDAAVLDFVHSPRLSALLADYIPLCSRASGNHALGAIAQGAIAIHRAVPNLQIKSTTTPLYMERTSYLFGTSNPLAYASTLIPEDKYEVGPTASHWVYSDEKYFYASGRHSGDVELLCKALRNLVASALH